MIALVERLGFEERSLYRHRNVGKITDEWFGYDRLEMVLKNISDQLQSFTLMYLSANTKKSSDVPDFKAYPSPFEKKPDAELSLADKMEQMLLAMGHDPQEYNFQG